MPTPYNASLEPGEAFVLEGRYCIVIDKRVEDGETQYLISDKGYKRWKPAALIDRNSSSNHQLISDD